MKTIEVFSAAVSEGPNKVPSESSIPLTFFDILWLRFPPPQSIFFYEFLHTPPFFFNTLLPKLKQSLSLTLNHFYPLSGHLTWPLQSNKPIIKFNKGDTVSLTISQSDSDFHDLTSIDLIEATKVHHLLPNLVISHEQSTLLALQITLFPNHGFSIGITSHHAVLDGRTAMLFIKSWAYLCKESVSVSASENLPLELCPFYDREVIKDPSQIEGKYVSDLLKNSGRSLMVWDFQVPEDSVRGLFRLSAFDIDKLRKFVVSKKKEYNNESIHLSTFVLSVAYALICRVKAEETESKSVVIIVNVDCTSRLEPRVPATYFGNCVGGKRVEFETRKLLGEDGLVVAVEVLIKALETLKEGVLSGAQNWLSRLIDRFGNADDVKRIGIAGSPKFEVYNIDFGCGRPKKVEVASIDGTGAFCLSDSKNGDGVEIGFVSNKGAMEAFASLFAKGPDCILSSCK